MYIAERRVDCAELRSSMMLIRTCVRRNHEMGSTVWERATTPDDIAGAGAMVEASDEGCFGTVLGGTLVNDEVILLDHLHCL